MSRKRYPNIFRMIREATIEDIGALQQIYNEAILHTVATFDTEVKDEADRIQWFEEHRQSPYGILVDEQNGVVTGYASLSRYRERKAFDGTVELSVYIDEGFRGKGIGSRLMEETLRVAQENPAIKTVVSLVTGENEHSIYLHRKFGFTYCGRFEKVGFKHGRWLDLNFYQIIYNK